MTIEVLITTMNKNRDDIIKMYQSMNINTDALFANQCDKDETNTIDINDHTIKVVSTTTRGVSINRNILLKNCSGDYCICIDDDCSLVNNYVDIINEFVSKHNFDIASFNGYYSKYNNRHINDNKTKRIRHYNQISFAGAPGILINRASFNKSPIYFREDVGVPNYICAGEDSLFFYDLLKNNKIVYRNQTLLFSIDNYDDESSYYEGVTERYVHTRGYITYLLHKYLYDLYLIRHAYRFKKRDKTKSVIQLLRWLKDGIKDAKDKKHI